MPLRLTRRSHPATEVRGRDGTRIVPALVALAILAGSPAAAQTSASSPFRLESFAARNEASVSNLFGGFSLSGYSGILGLRLNGAVAGFEPGGRQRVTETPVRFCSPRTGCRTLIRRQAESGSFFGADAWTADADLIAEPFRQVPVMRQLLLGFSPYAFAGIGRLTSNATSSLGADTSRAVWSYGAGVHHDLISRVGLTAEARVRRRLDDNAFIGNTFRDAVQYRVGLNVGLGGGARRSKRSAPEVVVVSRGRMPTLAAESPAPTSVPAAQATARTRFESLDPDVIVPRLIDAAEALLDTPWREGGATPGAGFDAGGFVQYVFAQEDIRVPRLVRELSTTGVIVSARAGNLRPGDLLFFSNDGGGADHVAIYTGRDRFVHATASGGSVMYDVLGEGARGMWFASHLQSVRRIIGARTTVSPSATPYRTPTRSPSSRPDNAPKPTGAP
jgi:cell wall-associated NlpC family hydrolase